MQNEKFIKLLGEFTGLELAGTDLDFHLTDDLGIDSLGLMELVMEVEEAFEISIPDGDAEGLLTVQAYCEYLNGKTG